ncbi:DNA-directed DNA polymerase II small subunit [Candidatus Bathyarchaeota archaeon]|nr:DNA-directed DNA polymerase II small subunit [Candidatus Bathyarchaeota archaeon]
MPEELSSLLTQLLDKGYQISPDAFQKLQEMPYSEADRLVNRVLNRTSIGSDFYLIDRSVIENATITTQYGTEGVKIPYAKKIDSRIEIISHEEARPSGDVDGYIDYFNSRYTQLENILKQRVDVRDSLPLSQALKLPVKSNLKTMGIVSNKSARGDRLFIDLEDTEAQMTVLVSGEELIKKGLEILDDQVICFEGFKYRDDLFIANDLIWPDVPMHDSNRSDEDVCAIFVGDIHVGSRWFREDLFDKFVKWMNLELGPQPSRDLASKVKYLVITGDLVDGVGIYPDQIDELLIPTQKAQYKEAAKLLSELPEYVEIIIIPGNHDAVRRSLPQPPIPEKYASELYDDPRVHMLPNPSTFKLHGVEVMAAHGKGLDDILSSTPGYDFHHPVSGVELMLRCRLFAPVYGQTTPIAPERIDRLVMRTVPDVLAMGHVHIYESRKYKGITLISSGSFQDQTPFQKRMKLKPTPGLVSVFNLKNHQQIPLDFERLD